jgi:regulator of replication initiation timing
MKKYLIIIGLILTVIGVIYGLSMRIKSLNSQLDAAQTNTKALMQQNLELDNSSRTLKLTIDQLEYAKDSISKKLVTALEDNHVNKKKIQRLQYQLTTNFRVDTITFRDTLFREFVDIDTTIRDQ